MTVAVVPTLPLEANFPVAEAGTVVLVSSLLLVAVWLYYLYR